MENVFKKKPDSLLKRSNKWLKVKFIEFHRLIGATKRLGPFSTLIRLRAAQLVVYMLVYPIVRVTLGRSNASRACDFLTKKPSLKIFPFPYPLKSKLIVKDSQIWSILIEMFINDVYPKDMIKKGMNIVDIGAHIGAHTIYFAEKVGSLGKVIAVEPEPKNCKELLENVELNGFKNVIIAQAALSDCDGPKKLYISPWSTGHSLVAELTESNGVPSSINVQVKTLDKLLEELNIKKIDMIKIDAEGTEMPILKGAQKTLKNNPEAKIIVASYHYPGELEEVQKFLNNMGFETEVSDLDIVTTK